jgi:hypothetical protein
MIRFKTGDDTMSKTLLKSLATLALFSAMVMPVQAHTLAIQIDESGSLTPTDVTHEHAGDAIQVSGWIEKRYPHRGRILGHVDIRFLDAGGHVVAEEQAPMVQYSPSRKDPQRARFSASLAQWPEQAVTLEVAHHVGDTAILR